MRTQHRFARNLLTEEEAARARARTDNRRAALTVVLLIAAAIGYAFGLAHAPWWHAPLDDSFPCDPYSNGCRFVDDGVTWQTVDHVSWPVCDTEDAAGPCVWDAHTDGNGTGHSFTVVDDVVTYIGG